MPEGNYGRMVEGLACRSKDRKNWEWEAEGHPFTWGPQQGYHLRMGNVGAEPFDLAYRPTLRAAVRGSIDVARFRNLVNGFLARGSEPEKGSEN